MMPDTTSVPPDAPRHSGEGGRTVPVGSGAELSGGPNGAATVADESAVADPHPVVASAVTALANLDELSVSEHVARYDAVHAALQEALTSIDGV